MDHAATYANEWQWIDGIESCSWTPSGSSAVIGVKAAADAIRRSDLQRVADLAIEPTLTAFVAWKGEAATFDPKQGDTLTDSSSVRWTIQSVEQQMLKTKWRLIVTKQV